MSSNRESARPTPASKAVTRRQILGSLGALAATAACSGTNEDLPQNEAGASGAGTAGNLPTAGGGSGGSAGTGVGKGGTAGTSGSLNATSGTGGTNSAGSAGSPTAGAGQGGTAGQATAGAGTGGTGTAGEGTGGAAGGTGGATGGMAGTAGSPSGGTGGGGGLVPPTFEDVPSCTASRTDGAGQGPFYIHDGESDMDVSLIRQDIRGRYNEDAEPGIDMDLHLRILDSTSTSCNGSPVPNVEVYIWHTDGQGFYSGFGTRGMPNQQNPDVRYSGQPNMNDLDTEERFCRGMQTTNADGIVSFKSIFPGWYNGRDVHIHVVILKPGSTALGRVDYNKSNTQNKWLFTTQFYFEPTFTASVHEAFEPYKRRTTGSLASAYEGAILADEGNNSGLRAKATLTGQVVTAQMNIVLNPA